jgi:hypothetical protein
MVVRFGTHPGENDVRGWGVYMSSAPAVLERAGSSFAGEPPSAITGADLVCIELGRRFDRRVSATDTVGLRGAWVTLWYGAGPAWEPMRERPDWIDSGVSTPNFDWAADGRDPASLTTALERSPIFEIASRERVLALTIAWRDGNADGPDELVVLRPR